MTAFQNWNNILGYIKSNLGENINFIELSDDYIINYLKNQTLPECSRFIPGKIWATINDSNLIEIDHNYNENTYRIPINEDDYKIINVQEVYYGVSSRGNQIFGYSNYVFLDPRDATMSNVFNDMISKLTPTQTYIFIPPNVIKFGLNLAQNNIIMELNVVHFRLDKIPHDSYNNYFKKKALKDVIDLIISNRSKYSRVQSPFGEIELNIDFLRDKKQELNDQIREVEEWDPPEKLIEFL